MLTFVTKKYKTEIQYFVYTLYICKQLLKDKEMKLQIAEDFDRKLTELYSSQVTVNLEAKSTMDPNHFWNSMELIAINHRATINFKVK